MVFLNSSVLGKVKHDLAIADLSSLRGKEQTEVMINELRKLFSVIKSFEYETDDKSWFSSGSTLESTMCYWGYYLTMTTL